MSKTQINIVLLLIINTLNLFSVNNNLKQPNQIVGMWSIIASRDLQSSNSTLSGVWGTTVSIPQLSFINDSIGEYKGVNKFKAQFSYTLVNNKLSVDFHCPFDFEFFERNETKFYIELSKDSTGLTLLLTSVNFGYQYLCKRNK